MEIERKWMVTDWPKGLPLTEEYQMDQGYISVRPTVRIRREALTGGQTRYVLCFKGEGTLSREEIETDISPDLFEKLRHLIGKPLIRKERRSYLLPEAEREYDRATAVETLKLILSLGFDIRKREGQEACPATRGQEEDTAGKGGER